MTLGIKYLRVKKSGKLKTESDLLNSHNQKNDLLNIPTFPIKSQGFVKK